MQCVLRCRTMFAIVFMWEEGVTVGALVTAASVLETGLVKRRPGLLLENFPTAWILMEMGLKQSPKQLLTPLHCWNVVNNTRCPVIIHSQRITWLKRHSCIATNIATRRGDDKSCLFVLPCTHTALKGCKSADTSKSRLWEQGAVGTVLHVGSCVVQQAGWDSWHQMCHQPYTHIKLCWPKVNITTKTVL